MVLLLLSIVMPSKYLNDSTYIPKQKRSKGYKLMRELWHITTNAAHRVVCACELKLQGSRKESIQKHTKRSKYFRCMQAVTMEVGASNKQVYNMNFDSNSAKVGIDNRCSACMSHIIEDFEGPLTEYNRPIKGFGGTKTYNVKRGTIVWRWMDDQDRILFDKVF